MKQQNKLLKNIYWIWIMLIIGICVVCTSCKESKKFKKNIEKNKNFPPCEQQAPFALGPTLSSLCPDGIPEISVKIYNEGLPGIYEISFPDGTIKTTEEVHDMIEVNHKFNLECDNMPGSPILPNNNENYFTYNLDVRRIDCVSTFGNFYEGIVKYRIAPNPLNGIAYSSIESVSFPHTAKFTPEICNQYLVRDYQWYVNGVSVGDSSVLHYSFEREGAYNIKSQVTNHFECVFFYEQEIFVEEASEQPYIFTSKPFSLNPTPMKRLESEFKDNSNPIDENPETTDPPPSNDESSGVPPEVVPKPSCNDNKKNGDEDGVDCGGSKCPPCLPQANIVRVSGELKCNTDIIFYCGLSPDYNPTWAFSDSPVERFSGSLVTYRFISSGTKTVKVYFNGKEVGQKQFNIESCQLPFITSQWSNQPPRSNGVSIRKSTVSGSKKSTTIRTRTKKDWEKKGFNKNLFKKKKKTRIDTTGIDR